jgi:hypothetical protein
MTFNAATVTCSLKDGAERRFLSEHVVRVYGRRRHSANDRFQTSKALQCLLRCFL